MINISLQLRDRQKASVEGRSLRNRNISKNNDINNNHINMGDLDKCHGSRGIQIGLTVIQWQ